MKSIKPGRGPSKMSALGSLLVAIFGVLWCVAAGAMGAWFMLPFGLLFVGFAIVNTVYHYHNATAEDRYSVVDVVDSGEEPDPLNEKYGKAAGKRAGTEDRPGTGAAYCPFCGRPVDGDFEFCPKCGRKLPD